MTASRAVFVGDVTWDTSVALSHLPQADEKVVCDELVEGVGGVVANAAVACHLAGTPASLHASIGDDLAGKAVRAALSEVSGLTTALHEETGGTTTRALILLDTAGYGEKRLILAPGAAMSPPEEVVEDAVGKGTGWLHTALYDIDSALAVIERCREFGVPWSIDLEPASVPSDEHLLDVALDGCTTVFLNARAAELFGSNPVAHLRARGVQEVVETLGPDGVRLHAGNQTGTVMPAPAFTSPVRDTTGAGDAFAGWYVAERVMGGDAFEAAENAVIAASYSVRSVGGASSYPARKTVESLLPHPRPDRR